MAEKKSTTRSYEAELRALPVELVPPDPDGTERSKKRQRPGQDPHPAAVEAERDLVGRLIDRIKRI